MQREQYEAALVSDPFNVELRRSYADVLFSEQEYQRARAQAELVLKSTSDDCSMLMVAACSCLELGDNSEALNFYMRAKKSEGFEEHKALEKLVKSAAPVFKVVPGTKVVAEVKPLFTPDKQNVTFNDVAGMERLKKTLRMHIIEPFKNPTLFQKFRKKAGGGVLLYGPPGCGKTLMARAVATECDAKFIAIGISDVLNMWIGESEKNLASIFEEARARRPAVLFFDELDALAYARSKSSSSSSRTVVNEFLNQLDGFQGDNDKVLVLAATNMPWDVDAALKRPGRLDRQIFVPPPDATARAAILQMKLTGIPCDDVNIEIIAQMTKLYSGADVDGLIELAKEFALSDMLESGKERALTQADFKNAFDEAVPTTEDWLKTARNLVKFAGADRSYKDVEKYLKEVKRY